MSIFHMIFQYEGVSWHVSVKITQLLESTMVLPPKLLLGGEHLMLNKPISCWICEIKHDKLLQKKSTHGLRFYIYTQ